ncbi:MAG: 16S rRNA (guanine(527)-N(7))-methyltransferase RsmG [Candidatus Izimaplasma sp.]|nr:16S rRNA (guanine(527)-N(7))-methyltransferase RsmG [Candidatus Izimaplasma bacterium]
MQEFIDKLKELGFVLSKEQLAQFDSYYNLLVEWNEKMNLTAIIDRNDVYMKHFYDSIMMSQIVTLNQQSLLDVGSGAGFPSIPLKILFPQLNVTIIDALNKRITFLNALCDRLNIDVRLIHGRAEEFKEREQFDLVTARAVASLPMLSELCIPFVKENGYFIVLKGPNYETELSQSKTALKILGVKEDQQFNYQLLGVLHVLVRFKKIKKTPIKYPRRFKQIKSNPL